MRLDLYTAQITYKEPDAYDITRKSGDPAFAPTWKLVQAWKTGKITWHEYSEQYRQMMLKSFRENQNAWQALLQKGTVTLTCYCKADINRQCHRYLLADFLVKLGDKAGITVINNGERTKDTSPQLSLF